MSQIPTEPEDYDTSGYWWGRRIKAFGLGVIIFFIIVSFNPGLVGKIYHEYLGIKQASYELYLELGGGWLVAFVILVLAIYFAFDYLFLSKR